MMTAPDVPQTPTKQEHPAADRGAPSLVAVDEEHRIVSWNQRCVELTGMAPDEALGRNAGEVLHELLGQLHGLTRNGTECGCGGICPVMAKSRPGTGAGGAPSFLAVNGNGNGSAPLAGRAPQIADHLRRVDLTKRQQEVLGLLVEGINAKGIAHHLWLTESTVRNHIRAILLQLGAHSQIEAVAAARRLGLVP